MKKNRKKLRYLFAVFALALCMMALPLTAYAGGGDESEEPPAETVSAVEAEPEPNPFTPDGTGTVVDTATDEDGKLFFTITTPSENVFYLVIDQQRTDNNVYFLNAVTENDLMALAEPSDNTASESALPDEPAAAEPEPAAEPDPADEQEPEAEAEQGGGAGMIILAVVVILGAGGAAYYFKIYRPKQEGADSGDEYEGQEPDADAWDDDAAPYPDDEDAPLWDDGGDAGDPGDGPPWYDEDEAEAREDYETDTGEGGDE